MATTSSQLSIIIAALTDLANRVQAAAWAAHVIISSRLCDTDLSHGINPVMPPIFPIVGDDELKVLSSLYANALLPRETARIDGKILKGMHEFEQRVDYANACRIRDRAAVAYGVLNAGIAKLQSELDEATEAETIEAERTAYERMIADINILNVRNSLIHNGPGTAYLPQYLRQRLDEDRQIIISWIAKATGRVNSLALECGEPLIACQPALLEKETAIALRCRYDALRNTERMFHIRLQRTALVKKCREQKLSLEKTDELLARFDAEYSSASPKSGTHRVAVVTPVTPRRDRLAEMHARDQATLHARRTTAASTPMTPANDVSDAAAE